jgi:hypothetical protein
MSKRMLKAERWDLVEAAVAESLASGYEAASVERIARRAEHEGWAVPSLGRTLFLFANQALAEPVGAIVAAAQRESSPTRGLGLFIERYLGFWSRRPRQMEFLFLAMTKLGEMPEARRAYSAYYDESIAVLASLYRRGLEAKELRRVTRPTALGLVAALDGALGMVLIDRARKANAMAVALRGLFVDAFRTNGKGRP